jgi:hypothetical protein
MCSVAVLSPSRPGFDPRPVCVRFVVDNEALGQVFLPVLQFSPVSIIPSMLHIHLHLHVALTRRTNGRSLGTFQKIMIRWKSDGIGEKDTFLFSFFGTSKGWQRWNKSHTTVM